MTLIIVLAFVIDSVVGDPRSSLHPIRIIGGVIGIGVNLHRKTSVRGKVYSFVYGLLLSAAVIAIAYITTRRILDYLYGLSYWAGFAAEAVLCSFTIAAKDLKIESMEVYYALETCDIEDAREKLSRIVGRDTENLSRVGIIKATVETIAENLSDGVVAPLLFVYLGGAPLGFAYKAANTLDSMIGYHNDEYEYFGKFAARLDDCLNFIPSRVSALLMIIATNFTKSDTKQALKTFIKDRYKHKSPNSAQTEAVCAGALGLQLGGDSYYRGKLVHKQTIGENIMEPEASHIIEANNLMYATAVLAVAVLVVAGLIRGILLV